jgi:hypothetical protein
MITGRKWHEQTMRSRLLGHERYNEDNGTAPPEGLTVSVGIPAHPIGKGCNNPVSGFLRVLDEELVCWPICSSKAKKTHSLQPVR